MPLDEKVNFKTILQRGNRLQVPKLVRWRYKLESDQVLKIMVHVEALWSSYEIFFVTMSKDGRIVVPQLVLALLQRSDSEKKGSLEGYVFNVTLEPS